MSLSSCTRAHDSRLELVDELRMQDIQVTGLSMPILVRAEGRRTSSRDFITNNIVHNTLRNLILFTESSDQGPPLNLTSVLYQHNSSPILSYFNANETTNLKIGGLREDEICSRLSSIFSQAAAPNILTQLCWFYIFEHKLSYIIPGWSQPPLVQYLFYTISPPPQDPGNFIPYCEPATKWIYCLRGKLTMHILPPTPSNVDAFKNFLESEFKDELYALFQTDSTEARLRRGQALFIPAGWIFYAERDAQTLEYGGEFFHSFSIEAQLSVWQLYKDSYFSSLESERPSFFTCNWLVLHAYLSSFQDTLLTTQETHFSLENHQSLLPHLSPFECRGMLFMIELIRSERLSIMKDCIPSCVNCPVSLLQKIQTILLHQSIFTIFSSPFPNGVMFIGTPKEGLTSISTSEIDRNSAKTKLTPLPFVSITNNSLQSSFMSSVNQSNEIDGNNNMQINEQTESIENHPVIRNSEITREVSEPTPVTSLSQCLCVSIPLTRIRIPNENSENHTSSDILNTFLPSPFGTNTSSIYYSDTPNVSKSLNGHTENSQDSQQSYQSCNLNNLPNDTQQLANTVEAFSNQGCSLRQFLTTYISDSKLRFCGICQYCTQPPNLCHSCKLQYNKHCSCCNNCICILSCIADIDITPEMLLNSPPIFLQLVQLLCAYPPLCLEPTLGYILDEAVHISRSSFLPIKKSSLKDIQDILFKIQTFDFGKLSVPTNQSTPLNTPSK